MVMFIHASKLACLNLPTRLVCPVGRLKEIKSRMLPRGHGIRQIASQWLSEDMCVIRDDCTLMMSCRGRICVSLSEGNAKTCLEQSPVTYSRKAYGPHKSIVTTPRKSVKSVLSVQIRV